MNRLPRVACLLLAVAVSSCSRDLTLPPFPPPGSLTGRITYAQPGVSDKRAAAGAAVGVMGSGLQTVTNPSGVFTLAWGDATDGLLMIRFDADGDGVIDRQRVVQLAEYDVGPNKHVDLGDLLLGENASVRGRVLRGDVPTHSGHSGSTVFLPEGPFAATTGDDGSFFLNDLPAGPVSLVAFRPGYDAHALGTVELRSGEQFTMADVVLQPAPNQPPGGLSGRLVFVPTAADVGDTAVSLEAPSQAPRVGSIDGTLAFHFDAVPPGLYNLRATRTGYTPLVVPNVLVPAGGAADLGTVEVTDQPIPDAGQPPVQDGGSSTDGGVPCTSGSCAACTVNAQCPSTEWCDQGRCSTLCTTSQDCSLGRSCDPATRTCVLACSNGFCPGGLSCDAVDAGAPLCRAPCDGTFPCTPGLVCDARGLCVPECHLAAECPRGLPVCHGGQCEAGPGCTDDRQCPVDKVCFQGACAVRPTTPVSGVYPCTTACDCRLDEWCGGGVCQSAPVPTAFFAAGATGDGSSPASPSGDLAGYLLDAGAGARLALKDQDAFFSMDAFRIRPGQDGLALQGGYTVCNATRWVRSDLGRTTLSTDAGLALDLGDPSGFTRLAGAEVSNLSLRQGATAPLQSCVGPVHVGNVDGPRLSYLDLTLDDSQCVEMLLGGSIQVDSSSSISVIDVSLTVAKAAITSPVVVGLTASFGNVVRVTMNPPAQPIPGVTLVSASNVNGPLSISDCVLPPLVAAGSVTGVAVSSCSVGNAVLLERNQVAWPTSSATQLINSVRFIGLSAANCGDVTVRDNTIDGSGVVGNISAMRGPDSTGVLLSGVAGFAQRNVVKLPAPANPASFNGIASEASVGPLTISDNAVTGGVTGGNLTGLGLEPLSTGGVTAGPIVVERNFIDVGASGKSVALEIINVPPGAGLTARDNFFRATSGLSCASPQSAYGVDGYGNSGLFERNRIFASGGTTANAFHLLPEFTFGTMELYANHLWSGPAVCTGGTSVALSIQSSQSIQFYLGENTIDGEGDVVTEHSSGVFCDTTPILARGNVISGGRGLVHAALDHTGPGAACYDLANYQQNLFWLPPDAGAFAPTDAVFVMDGGANVTLEGVSPYDAVQPRQADGGLLPPSRLAAGSLAVDRGVLALRRDGSPVLADLDGRPRDGGLGPDMGCCER